MPGAVVNPIVSVASRALGEFGEALNPGAANAGRRSEALTAGQTAYLRQLREQSGEVFGLGREEYAANKPLIGALRERAKYLGSEEGQAAKAGRASADVTRAYTQAKEAQAREDARMGLNPNDPASRTSRGAGLARVAGARVGASNLARRAARQEGQQITEQLSGRSLPMLTAGMQGQQAAAAGFGQAAQTAQQDPRQGMFGIPGLSISIARGGSVRAPMGGVLPYRDEQRPSGPAHAGAGLSRDPNPRRDIGMVQGPDGAYSPEGRPPDAAGTITGPGTETSDSIPARLSHGEYVLPAFVGEAMGSPATDAVVEVARGAQEGDPEARDDLMKLLKTIAGFRSTQDGVPTRVAGKEPMMPMGGQHSGAGLGATKAAGGGRILRRKGFLTAPEGGRVVESGAPRHKPGEVTRTSSFAPAGIPWWAMLNDEPSDRRRGESHVDLSNLYMLGAGGPGMKHGGRVGAGLQPRG